MADEESSPEIPEGPEGAAILPLIPDELGIHPLMLATLHAIVFFDGSDEAVVNEAAAEEGLEYIATYLQRLRGPDLRRIQEDVETLLEFARQQKWPADFVEFLRSFLRDFGVGEEA
jgi:hypothetical protein